MPRPSASDVLDNGVTVTSASKGVIFDTFTLANVPAVLSDRVLADMVGFNWHDYDFKVERHQLLASDPMTATVTIVKD